MLLLPQYRVPITKIPLPTANVELYMKREDLIHDQISGNKYWKLFYNVNEFLKKRELNVERTYDIITFGGAFSNHIAAVSSFAKLFGLKTLGIIRGDELIDKWKNNITLKEASEKGMHFQFVTREEYRRKSILEEKFADEYPHALILPEGGTNDLAIHGIKHMLGDDTKDFCYLCCAVGTGGTLSGISKFSQAHQTILGFSTVKDDSVLYRIQKFSERKKFKLFPPINRYGKVCDGDVRFINEFYRRFSIPLDPIYTGKMMQELFLLISSGFFPKGSRVLAFHTGGLQAIPSINEFLKSKNRAIISFK